MDPKLLQSLKSQLIVSCQAPPSSPLHHPSVIAAIALACVKQGAAGLRIDTPQHLQAVRKLLPTVPLIGLWKKDYTNSEIYITPTCQEAMAVVEAGADIIAIDATLRPHPQESVKEIIAQIHKKNKLVMADIDTPASAIAAWEAGADVIATTLYGYTPATQHLTPPGYSLLQALNLPIPLICEGGIATPAMAQKALSIGAYAVVVGTAITGIDQKVQDFCSIL
jgi:N-acylglucosamine-6-phosphate 2-epimerase